MKNAQLARQLQLLERLLSPRGSTVEQLAAELDCSRRTVFRDLRCLEKAGIEVLLNAEDSSYTLADNFGLLAPRLFSEELLALALALGTSPLMQTPELAGLIEQILGKLLAKAPLEQREQITRTVRACRITPTGEQPERLGLLRKLLEALSLAEQVRIVCRSEDGRRIIHDRVTPVALHLEGDQWALGYRTAPNGETIVLPMAQIVDVQPHEASAPVFSRHLLSQSKPI